jgi:hypothetical protein
MSATMNRVSHRLPPIARDTSKLKHSTLIKRLSKVFDRCQEWDFTTPAEDKAIQQALQELGATGFRKWPRPVKQRLYGYDGCPTRES